MQRWTKLSLLSVDINWNKVKTKEAVSAPAMNAHFSPLIQGKRGMHVNDLSTFIPLNYLYI